MEYFRLKVISNTAVLEDSKGEKLILVYEPGTHSVHVKGEEDYESVF